MEQGREPIEEDIPDTKRWSESPRIRHIGTEELHELMWELNTKDVVPGQTWWWWWWIFFIKNPKNPSKPRQLMVLWSTKDCDTIKVDDFDWFRRRPITRGEEAEEGSTKTLDFNGMVAVWYYDGETMKDPFRLKECDFKVERKERSGALLPSLEKDYNFTGEEHNWVVNIKGGPVDFHFEMGPWNTFLTSPRHSKRAYIKQYGYEILKIFGTTLKGTIESEGEKEEIDGSAYFQKVTVNAPTIPWFWCVLHTERGDYLDYFIPHVGPSMFRKKLDHKSVLDRQGHSLSRHLQFYNAPIDRLFRFRDLKISKSYDENDLPTFILNGKAEDSSIRVVLKSYSRATWRFQQKYLKLLTSILYYNEYPVTIAEFELKWQDEKGEEKRLLKEDLGQTMGNCEHAWGKLI